MRPSRTGKAPAGPPDEAARRVLDPVDPDLAAGPDLVAPVAADLAPPMYS